MTTLASSQSTGVEVYEDMFKEITRKLYGEETGHGLLTLGTPVAHVATAGPTVPEGERSFTTLLSDRNLTSIDYDHGGTDGNNLFKNDDHLTAFGLALMQNGFQPPSAILNSHTFQQMNKQQQITNSTSSATSLNNGMGSSSGGGTSSGGASINHPHVPGVESAEPKWTSQSHSDDLNAWNAKSNSFQTAQKSFKAKKTDASETAANNANSATAAINKSQSPTSAAAASAATKRYTCSSCPYSTDRRDLFTRHENIHKEEKPFHCYVCLKQFNRADHVKKHFLRMHRGIPYDITRTKRSLTTQPKKSSSTSSAGSNYYNQTTTLNIPNAYQSAQHTPTIIDQSNSQSLGSAHPQQTQQHLSLNTSMSSQLASLKVEKGGDKSSSKKKGDKRFTCCYCTWTGSDNWGLKRHLNTHTKPYVCMLCDYKAARSERLATHVFKVHNKKACTKCNYLAENQDEYDAHVYEAHAHETRPARNNANQANPRTPDASTNVLRNINNSFNVPNSQLNSVHSAVSSQNFGWRSSGDGSANTVGNIHNSNVGGNGGSGSNNSSSKHKSGDERLFQYMEADGSDPEDYTRQLQMAALSRNTASVAQDFHNAGGRDKAIIEKLAINNNQSSKTALRNDRASSSDRCSSIETNQSFNVNAYVFNTSIDDFTHDTQSVDSIDITTMTTQKNVSPPAVQRSFTGAANPKLRRRNLTNEKENEIAYMDHTVTQKKSSKSGGGESVAYNWKGVHPRSLEEMSRRKQSLPRKCSTANGTKDDAERVPDATAAAPPMQINQLSPSNRVNAIRYKHLERMVSKKESCKKCQRHTQGMVLPHHTKRSLLLHRFWRHSNHNGCHGCAKCDQKFATKYKQILHMRLNHH